MSPILEAQNVTIGYTGRRRERQIVAEGLTLALLPGELVCLIGPNGAGKSTLLRTLSGLQRPLCGSITLRARDLTSWSPLELARSISVVLTERVHVGMLSAFALVALGRHPYTDWLGTLQPHDIAVIEWALRAVGAESLTTRNVHELSDGEQQKVLIARALAQQPQVMILDEPTAFLDLPRRVEIMSLLRQLTRETGAAILLSTHDLDVALRTADRIWLMPVGDPLVVGAPEDLVLSGAFARTFASEGVTFDQQHGAFTICSAPRGEVALVGDGLPAIWTQRALERAGFRVNHHPTTAWRVAIHAEDGQPVWQVTIGDDRAHYHAIYDVIARLRRVTPPAQSA